MTSARVLPGYFKHIRIATIVFALLMVYAVLPMSAHAAGLNQTQMQAVLGLLKSFDVDSETVGAIEAQLGEATVGSGSSNLSTTNTNLPKPPRLEMQITPAGEPGIKANAGMPGASACGQLERSLGRGSQGDDVNNIQNFLQRTGDLHLASTTGFFGDATERALQAWQAREGIVSEGDAGTTGFGSVGPKTRMILMMRCKELGGLPAGAANASSTTMPFATDANAGPVCVLKANHNEISLGSSVVLVWESKNATYASSISGERGPIQGSVIVTPTQTTTFLKKVYDNNGNVGQCTRTVVVKGTTPAAEKKVVIVPTKIDFARVFSLMGDGMAAVMDGYLSLYGLSLE